jgi:hypothetical protein
MQGRGKPGARRSRIAGAGEGEGGEPMPDAEASPLLPDEAPAENSIEGEPLRKKQSGPAGCRASASCQVARLCRLADRCGPLTFGGFHWPTVTLR